MIISGLLVLHKGLFKFAPPFQGDGIFQRFRFRKVFWRIGFFLSAKEILRRPLLIPHLCHEDRICECDMDINEFRPVLGGCYTEKFGTQQCMLAVRENVLRQFGKTLNDAAIERVLREGNADIAPKYLEAIRQTASAYVDGIFRRLREHEYDPELMRLYVVGGGGCLVRNFGRYDKGRVSFNDDICATAKEYEMLTTRRIQKEGGVV